MAIKWWDREREQLEQKLLTPEYQELLGYLQSKSPFMRQFRTWADVIEFLRTGTAADPRKDEVLLPILWAHGEDQDPRWRAILLVIFWPGLESISHTKDHWDENSDELWQNVVWTFLRVVCRLDVNRRPARLVQKVVNDTIHHLHDEYRRRWRRVRRELASDPDDVKWLGGGAIDIDIEAIDLRQAHERKLMRLRGHLDAGRISESDFLLLVGTRLYGETVAEHAREVGLDYQVAKKRRQRAEARIRQSEQEMQRSSETVSPREVVDPPSENDITRNTGTEGGRR
ncbi:MAG: hypothetical protein ABIK85_10415 [Candidatus Eisenbacteria bacterium]